VRCLPQRLAARLRPETSVDARLSSLLQSNVYNMFAVILDSPGMLSAVSLYPPNQ